MINETDLLNYSKELYAKKDTSEVENRNITRSAYYAMYHKLLEISESIPADSSIDLNCGSHEKLIRKLASTPEHAHLSEMLKSHRASRVKADYFLSHGHTRATSYKTLRAAEKFFESL